jgi:hypothetical protein
MENKTLPTRLVLSIFPQARFLYRGGLRNTAQSPKNFPIILFDFFGQESQYNTRKFCEESVTSTPVVAGNYQRAKLGKSLVVQNLPGTGKSPTHRVVADFAARGNQLIIK